MGNNVILFGADMSSSVHNDSKGKDILILGEGSIQRLDDTTLTAEATNFINLLTYLLNLHNQIKDLYYFYTIMEAIASYLLMLQEYEIKNSEIKNYALCLGNISKDFKIDSMKKSNMKRSCKNFFVDFNLIDITNILDVHKYLMKRT